MVNQNNLEGLQNTPPKVQAKNYLLLSSLLLIAFLSIGSIALLGYKNTQLQNALKEADRTENNGVTKQFQNQKTTLPNIEKELLDATDWINQVSERQVEFTGPDGKTITNSYGFSFKYPDNWTLEKDVDSKGCGTHTISKENMGELKIKTICQTYSAAYYPVPSDGKIVKEIEGVTVDGSIIKIIRFLSNPNRFYKYAQITELKGETYAFETKMNDPLSFISAEIELRLMDYPQSEDITSKTLLVADTIVASINRLEETQ